MRLSFSVLVLCFLLSACTIPQVVNYKGFEFDLGPQPAVTITQTAPKRFLIQVQGRRGQEFKIVQQVFDSAAERMCYKPRGWSGHSLVSRGGLQRLKGIWGVYGLKGEVQCR